MTKLKIDKSNWKRVKFGDVVYEPKETVKDLVAENIEHVVGLEHIDSDDIHLRKSASLAQSTTFTKKFTNNDVLFGRRRAYLRKAAQAEFKGICSGDITVFRAKPALSVSLLPFVVNNDAFFDYAVKHSAGGLSPRVKFRDLADYEFLLPPPEEQEKLAELLWAMDEVIERENEASNKLKAFLESEIEAQIHGVNLKGKSINSVIKELEREKKVVRLRSLGQFLKGKGIAKSDVINEGIPCVRYGELYTKHDKIIRNYYSFITTEIALQSLLLNKNDVLFAGSGETINEIGKSAAFIDEIEAYAGSDTLVFRPEGMDGKFLGYLMNSQLVRQQLNRMGTGATVMHIYSSDLYSLKVPKYDLQKQQEISSRLELINENLSILQSKKSSSKALQKSLINQIF